LWAIPQPRRRSRYDPPNEPIFKGTVGSLFIRIPRDAIEEFLVRNVIDLTWEILRLRRVKAGIIAASAYEGRTWHQQRDGQPRLQ
jgi:hypothetical protein